MYPTTPDCSSRELALLAQLVSSGQEFPCDVPRDLSQLPAELMQRLPLIPAGVIPDWDGSTSFLLLSAIQAQRATGPILAPFQEKITQILHFIVLFPSIRVSLIWHIACLLPFLKLSCLFAKQEDLLVLLSGHRQCKTRQCVPR